MILCLNFDFSTVMLVAESIKITNTRETLGPEQCFSKCVLNVLRTPRDEVMTLKMKKSVFTKVPRLPRLETSF